MTLRLIQQKGPLPRSDFYLDRSGLPEKTAPLHRLRTELQIDRNFIKRQGWLRLCFHKYWFSIRFPQNFSKITGF